MTINDDSDQCVNRFVGGTWQEMGRSESSSSNFFFKCCFFFLRSLLTKGNGRNIDSHYCFVVVVLLRNCKMKQNSSNKFTNSIRMIFPKWLRIIVVLVFLWICIFLFVTSKERFYVMPKTCLPAGFDSKVFCYLA